jgi:hypothetical protein
MVRFVAILLLVMATCVQAAEVPQMHVELDQSFKPGTGVRIPPDIVEEFEYYDNEVPRVFQWDLNGDNKYETLVKSNKSMCGNGGCEYVLIDGMTGRTIANVFGSDIFILKKKKGQSFPDLRTYSYMGGNRAAIDTYSYRHGNYVVVSHFEVTGKEISRYQQSLTKVPVVKSR